MYRLCIYYVEDYGKITFYLFHTSQWLDFVCSTNLQRHKDTHLGGWAVTQRGHAWSNEKVMFTRLQEKPDEPGFKKKTQTTDNRLCDISNAAFALRYKHNL